MAELADALRSGRSGLRPMWVQLPPSALDFSPKNRGFYFLISFDISNSTGEKLARFRFIWLAPESRVEYDEHMKAYRVWGKRAYIVVGLVIMVSMVMDFNSRMTRLNHLRAQKEREKQQLLELKLTRVELQNQIAYMSSDEAVEEWAREEGRMIQPGDTVVVPLPDASYMPEVIKEEVTFPQPESNWDAWMQWLFFSSP